MWQRGRNFVVLGLSSAVRHRPGFDLRNSEGKLIPIADHQPQLSKYELQGEIGHGGMATVYRARDKRLGREVAVKVIHRHLRENREVRSRFASEALAVAKLKHPNIVEVYDVSAEEEAERYLVVELVEGLTLRQLLTEQAPLPPEVAACFVVEVCRALAHAHRNGIVHRDVKPENVLIKVGGDDSTTDSAVRVKLTDFGIAKLLDAQGVTHTGQVLGSPAHMAPEQIEGGEVDARSDVFGAGVLLYELLTGVLPFEGKNPAQVLRRVLDGAFLPAERMQPRVGARFGRIAATALARSPDDRFASARELEEALLDELTVCGVTEVRGELAKFLRDPAQYRVEHDERVPTLLAERGARAREERDVLLAAVYFNRALAYRPDDTVLLSEVAGLAHRQRMKRVLLRVGTGVTLSLFAIGLVVLLVVLLRPRLLDQGPAPGSVVVRPPIAEKRTKPVPSAVASADLAPEEPEGDVVSPEGKPQSRPRTVVSRPRVEPKPGTRLVRTPVVGPQNARVRIDGRIVPWFQTHELPLGPHTFEFVPPNSECCEASAPTTVEVVAGAEVQIVRGIIAFKPATLRLEAPSGTRASCGLGEVLEAGGVREIPMSRPVRDLTCTLMPPAGTGGAPRQVPVSLRPGRTFTISGS